MPNESNSEPRKAAIETEQSMPLFLREQIAALDILLHVPEDTGILHAQTIDRILRHFRAIREKAAAHDLPRIQRPCELSIRLLEDAKTYGYSAADHGYVADTVLPFLKRCLTEGAGAAFGLSGGGEAPRVLESSTDGLFQNFYDFVSANQRIRRRMEAFRNCRSYHYKDLHYIQRLLKQGPTVSRVLDVGCCGTVYPDLFDLDKVDYVGVDISEISLKRMATIYEGKEILWLRDDATTLARVEDGGFDLILATQVLEHLPDPEKALATMVRKLSAGGRLMIGTEGAVRLGDHVPGRWRRLLAAGSLLLGSYYLVHGMFPYVFPHRETHSYLDLSGNYQTIAVPHFHFHPLFFARVIEERQLPAKVSFIRVSGLAALYRLGPGWHFFGQEIKARIPVLRYVGGQVFVVVERTKPSIGSRR